MTDYRDPVARLLTLGAIDFHADEWPDSGPLGFTPDHIPELLRLAQDPELLDQNPNTAPGAAPLHAWRALARLGTRVGRQGAPLLELFRRIDDDGNDLVAEELPSCLAEFGPELLPALKRYLADPARGVRARAAAADTVEKIAGRRPGTRREAIGILAGQLERYPDQDADLTDALIRRLLALRAVEQAPLIAAVHALDEPGLVDRGPWGDACRELGLTPRQVADAENYAAQALSRDEDDGDRRELAEQVAASRAEPTATSAPAFISWYALNRMLENEIATDPQLRAEMRAAGRPVVSDYRDLPDEALLAIARDCGMELDRDRFLAAAAGCWSAEELARQWPVPPPPGDRFAGDRRWICLVWLWSRWLPDRASCEMIDDRMQAGYRHYHSDDPAAGRIWFEVWRDIHRLAMAKRLTTRSALDEAVRLYQTVSNWLGDFLLALHGAGMPRERIAFCEQALAQLEDAEELLTPLRRGLTDGWLELGDRARADALYANWLDEHPEWGQGWIDRADCWWGFRCQPPDYARAETILLDGLAVPDVEDLFLLRDRLIGIYRAAGWRDRHQAFLRRLEEEGAGFERPLPYHWRDLETGYPPPAPRPRRDGRKVGRNDPCPCGSGKKYKRCCG